jgi:ATP-dependent RNA helicase SUPV3L1/SUV3
MLSITGMTLDQFSDLMTGLGYKVEKGEREKVKAVVAAPAEATAEGEEVPAEAPEVADALSDEAAAVEAPAAEMETFYSFTWGGRAPRQARPQGGRPQGDAPKGERPQGGKPRGKGKPKGKGPAGGNKPQKFEAKPRAEKKIDPDNPFAAALAGLIKD